MRCDPECAPNRTVRSAGGPRTRPSPPTGDYGSFRFSSEDLPRPERIPLYRDMAGQRMASYSIEPIGEEFSCRTHLHCLHNLGIAHVAGSPVRTSWGHITADADNGPGLVLVMNLSGTITLSHRGREAIVPAGSSILFSSADASRMERSESRFVLLGMPQKVLAAMLADSDSAMMSLVQNTIEPLRLLAAYIDLLVKDPALMESAELRRLAVDHIHDLVAMALGATRDAAEIGVGRGLRAARLRAIKADIEHNLAGDVTVAALAARHRLSGRYIRKLFEGESTSLSKFVLSQRLARVHRMLANPRYAERTIADIVFAVGFGDVSTFNREFRRRFGVRPSDVRHCAQLARGHDVKSGILDRFG